jgi:Ca2+-binding EF-hand superfamily protein
VRTRNLILTLAAGLALSAQPPADMTETLFSYDKNKDGKLTREELPERMQGILERADADRDGFLTREEVQKATAGMGGGRGGMMMNPLLRALDTDQDGKLSAAEIAAAPAALKTLDKNGDGMLDQEELRPPMRGGRGEGRERRP